MDSIFHNMLGSYGVDPHNTARLLQTTLKDMGAHNIVPLVLRIVLVGALIAGLRKAFTWISSRVGRALMPTAYIAVHDTSYLWVMAWLAQDPSAQAQIKDFQLSTSEWRQVRSGSGNALRVETQKNGNVAPSSPSVGEHNSSWSVKDIIGQVLPTYHQSIRIRHGNRYLWVTRKMGIFARSTYRTVDHIQIRTLVWQKNALKDFLAAAHQQYFAKQDQELLIFHPLRINAAWQKPVSRPARPWSSVVLPEQVKEDLLRDVEKFLSEKETSWYAARGIPHRRGYLFHGVPGSGKTTLATAIASKLRLDIYVINPSQRGMDDAKLNKLFRDCPARSIILIEDIDCIFPSNRGRTVALLGGEDGDVDASSSTTQVDTPSSPEPRVQATGSHDLAPSTVTLSGLLNAIDGVSSQEGCILIASTNHPEHLDPALRRAGRFDIQVPFFNANPAQARDLFKHFFPLSDFASSADSTLTDASGGKARQATISGQAELDALADEFAYAIFPSCADTESGGSEGKSVSMATLQGYLLKHKEDPLAAVRQASEWAATVEEAQHTTKQFKLSSIQPPSAAPVINGETPVKGKAGTRKNGKAKKATLKVDVDAAQAEWTDGSGMGTTPEKKSPSSPASPAPPATPSSAGQPNGILAVLSAVAKEA